MNGQQESSIEWQKYKKVFFPTEEVYLTSAEEAITAFEDKGEGKRRRSHAVVLTKGLQERLAQIAQQNKSESLAAQDVAAFISRQLEGKNNPDQRSMPERLYDIPLKIRGIPQLDLIISDARNVEEFYEREKGRGLGERFQVICQHPSELNAYKLAGFRASIVRFDKVDPNIRREGIKEVTNNPDLFNELKIHARPGMEFPLDMFQSDDPRKGVKTFYPNQFILVHPSGGGTPIAGQVMGHVKWNANHSRFSMQEPWAFHTLDLDALMGTHVHAIRPFDYNQALLLRVLGQQHIEIIYVTGGAASGKTIVAYAKAVQDTYVPPKAAQLPPELDHLSGAKRKKALRDLEKRADPQEEKYRRNRFERIFLTSTTDLIGGKERERGFRKGGIREKLEEGIQKYRDAHRDMKFDVPFDDLESRGFIEVQDYATWRGRTLSNSVIFLDEAQNLKPIEMKHLQQRIGLRSLVIVSGDYEDQIDSGMTATSNGLFQGLRHYLGEPYVAVINLEGSYRSAGAEHAARWRVYK